MSNSLYSLQMEKNALSGLLNNPEDVLPVIDIYVKENDFHEKLHTIIYSVARQIIIKKEKIDRVILAEKIVNLNIKFNQDISVYDYIENLMFNKVNKSGAIASFKKLVELRVRRDLITTADKIKAKVIENLETPISELISECDGIYDTKIKSLSKLESGARNIFDEMESTIEEIGNNPPKESNYMMGPFHTINRIYGSLSRPGNITVIGARSGVGKTSVGMFYNIFLACEYGVPILHMDNGEMSAQELVFRAACMLTEGKVPFWAIESGKWRNNPEWVKLLRDVWPVAKRMKMYYEDVSDLSPIETINLIRRYSYNIVGRDNQFICNYDYLKPIEGGDRNLNEWQKMGFFIKDIKSFITNELPIPFWASLQLNKTGITTNRSSRDVVDDESTFSISDKIVQQSSHSFLVRQKTWDEIAHEDNRFGNLKAIPLKYRHLGEDFRDAIDMVRIDKKTFKKNYINLNADTFYFEDCGDLKQMVERMKEKFNTAETPPTCSEGGDDDSNL